MPPELIYYTRRQNGSPNAAADLYGLGLRVGAYLQILGMLLPCLRSQKRSRIGIKLLSSSVCVALLSSWTVLVCRRSISPCEAWLILSLTLAYGAPQAAAINVSGKRKGGIAILICAISVIWQEAVSVWFFATLYRNLPLLGTSNRVWFFTAVDISGWFRVLMLVYSCVVCLLLPFQVVSYLSMGVSRFSAWTEGSVDEGSGDEDNQTFDGTINHGLVAKTWSRSMKKLSSVFTKLEKTRFFGERRDLNHRFWRSLFQVNGNITQARHKKIANYWRLACCFAGFSILALTVAGVEKIIDYNDLSTENDLSRPGQMIPFVLGIITLIEGAANACMPEPFADSVPHIDLFGGSNTEIEIALHDLPDTEGPFDFEERHGK